jgi:hypothetical protein
MRQCSFIATQALSMTREHGEAHYMQQQPCDCFRAFTVISNLLVGGRSFNVGLGGGS